MREQQIFDVTQVHFAIVETTGKISFLLKKDYQPAEKQDVSAGGSTENPPSVIIRDGVTDKEQLRLLGLGDGWLKMILRENNVTEKGVFLLMSESGGKYTIIKKAG